MAKTGRGGRPGQTRYRDPNPTTPMRTKPGMAAVPGAAGRTAAAAAKPNGVGNPFAIVGKAQAGTIPGATQRSTRNHNNAERAARRASSRGTAAQHAAKAAGKAVWTDERIFRKSVNDARRGH